MFSLEGAREDRAYSFEAWLISVGRYGRARRKMINIRSFLIWVGGKRGGRVILENYAGGSTSKYR